MAGYFSSSSGYFGSSAPAPAPPSGGGGGHGVFGIFKNLGSDLKNAVEGFIPGTIKLAEHPIGGAEQMAKATWSTWSPLFHGQFTKFGQGVYDHPLAPILDVASVLSLGAGLAAKAGTIGDAMAVDTTALDAAGTTRAAEVGRSILKQGYIPAGGKLERDANILSKSHQPVQFQRGETALLKADNMFHAAARLKLPRGRIIEGQLKDGSLSVVPTHYSQSPLRRLMQEKLTPNVISKLPPNAQSVLGQMVFRHHMYGWMARRSVITQAARLVHIDSSARLEAEAAKFSGKMPTLDAVMMAGRELTDGEKAANWRTHLAVNMHINLARHAPFRAPDRESAVQFLLDHPHWGPVSAVPNGMEQDALIQNLRRREGRFNAQRAKNAEAANSVDNLRGQLDLHNQNLQDMYDQGWKHTQTPALNSKGEPALNPTAKQSMNQHAAAIDEQTRIVKRLNAELERAVKAKRIHDNAVDKLNTLTPQRVALEQRGFTDFYRAAGSSHEAFTRFANSFGRYGVRSFKAGDRGSIERAVDRAFVGKDGSIPIVPKHDPQMLGQELASSAGFARHMYRNSTRLWKAIQVKWTPKTFTNNTVANHTIALFRHSDPLTAFRSLYHALRLSHGAGGADHVLMRATPWRNKSWLMQNFQPELHNNFLEGVEEDLSMRSPKQAATRIGRVLKGPGAYSLVTKAADEPVRLAAIVAHVFNDSRVIHEADRLQKVAGDAGRKLGRTEALDRAAGRILKAHPELRENAANYARTIAGDYLAQTPVERGIKDTVPFYLWDRHILKSGTNIAMDNPIRMAILQQVSTGGLAAAQKFMGQMPAFLAGAVPLQMLGMSGSSGGRMNALVAPSLNPFGTLGDMAGAVQQATVGGDPNGAEDLLGQINPLLTDSISAATGKNILTGTTEKMAGGVIPTVLSGMLQGFPESKVVESAVNGPITTTTTPSGKTYPKLYSQNELAAITNLLGVPIKQISPSTAQYEAKAQAPRRKKIGNYF